MQQERVKPTLKRTKFACVNCKAAKAACDSNRPCAWCIRHALQDSCVDAPRKTRTSKKICCDPSLHKSVVFKQEYRNNFPLALAADFTPTTAIPAEPPLSPPSEIFPIEDLLAPSFDFGFNSASNQPCSNCPLFQTCARDAPQRLICATSTSPPQSPLSPEQLQLEDGDQQSGSSNSCLPPMSLSSHPDYCMQPLSKPSELTSNYQIVITPQPIQISPPQPSRSLSISSPLISTPSSASPSPTPSPSILTSSSSSTQVVTVAQARTLQGCCSFATSPHLPPLLDDVCNCQSLVQREMAKINASLETISALMQLQNASLLPTATFQVPNTQIEDCNDEFAKALGYDSRDDLFATAAVDALTQSTKQLTTKEEEEEEELNSSKPKQNKPLLTSLIPERWVPGVQKCATDLQKASLPLVNQLVFTSKRGDNKYFTVLIKPCGWFSYISILKQHQQLVEGLVVCGETS